MYISEWLVLGPITTKKSANQQPSAKDIIEDIDRSSLGKNWLVPPNNITTLLNDAPNKGDEVDYQSDLYDQQIKWQYHELSINWSNLDEIKNNIGKSLGQEKNYNYALAFFVVYIRSPEERKTTLKVRSDDSIRVWLNGNEISQLQHLSGRKITQQEDSSDIKLEKGYNILTIALGNQEFNWGMSARIENDTGLEFSTKKPTSYISRWLVLGPIFNSSDQIPPHSLTDKDPDDKHPKAGDIINEIEKTTLADKNLTRSLHGAPKHGDSLHYASNIPRVAQEYIWYSREFSINWQNISEIENNIHRLSPEFAGKNHALAFFLVYIKSSEEKRETKFCVRSDDSIKVWLNGEELNKLRHVGDRNIPHKEVCDKVELKQGYNILMVAVAETHVEWGFSVRVENDEGLIFTTEKPEVIDETTECLQIFRNPWDISSCYSIFEKDQVLTHQQLNSITNYFNEQTRFTRVKLIGVGIVCGLQILIDNQKQLGQINLDNGINSITITPGVGITTAGDLLYFDNNMVFDKFRLYDESNPKYELFYRNEEMIIVYELVRHDVDDTCCNTTSLNQFDTQTQDQLKNMVVVLFMESYVNDLDLCSSTGCDNLGKSCVNTIRVLLVRQEDISLLNQVFDTPHSFYDKLVKISADRPRISFLYDNDEASSSALSAFERIVNIYREKCNAIHEKLVAAWEKDTENLIFKNELKDRLRELNTRFQGQDDCCIQYYYDFLKDCVETYNHFRELMFGDTTWYCPATQSFPKHLLLGNLSDPNNNRTGFYPSPIVSRTSEQWEHAKFLAQKLDMMIRTFEIPNNTDIRITPSLFEDHALEERAIPYYYRVDENCPIHENWNYRLHQRGMDAYNYSYHADSWANDDENNPAANPLAFQIGRFSFFRIEGHIGKEVQTACDVLKEAIKNNNLPFAVCKVILNENFHENFEQLISVHPSIEHFAGVVRGGTFVLVYHMVGNGSRVVGDFMLPYYWHSVFNYYSREISCQIID